MVRLEPCDDLIRLWQARDGSRRGLIDMNVRQPQTAVIDHLTARG